MTEWKFADPPNVAVIVDRSITVGEGWIAHVSHNADDGAWQFHAGTSKDVGESQPMLVSLRSVVQLDPSIIELTDLPLGWVAWRDTKDSVWQRGAAGGVA